MNYVSFRHKALVYCEEHDATFVDEDDWGGLVYCKDGKTGDVYGVSQERVASYYKEYSTKKRGGTYGSSVR